MKNVILYIFLVSSLGYYSQSATNDSIYEKVDVLAGFPGREIQFQKYLIDHMQFQPKAIVNDLYKVQLSFVVKKDGSIGEVTILSEKNDFYDKEAIRLIKNMPNWIPAKIDNENVNSIVTKIIVFDLNIKINQNEQLINIHFEKINQKFNTDQFFNNLYATPFLNKKEIKYFEFHMERLIYLTNEIAQIKPNYTLKNFPVEDYRGMLISFNYFIIKLHKQKNKNISSAFSSLTNQIVTEILKKTDDNATIITDNIVDYWAFWYINETEKINPTLKIISPILYINSNNRAFFSNSMNFESLLDTNFISKYKTTFFLKTSQTNYIQKFNQLIDTLKIKKNDNSLMLNNLKINYLNDEIVYFIPSYCFFRLKELIILDIINQSKGPVIFEKKPEKISQYCSNFLHYYKLQNTPYTKTKASLLNEPFIRNFLLTLEVPQRKFYNSEFILFNWLKELYVVSLIQKHDEQIFEKFLKNFPLNDETEIKNLPYTMSKIFFDFDKPELAFKFLNAKLNLFNWNEIREIFLNVPNKYMPEVVKIFNDKGGNFSSIAYVYKENNKMGLIKNNVRLTEPIYERIQFDSLPLNQFKLFQTNLVGIATENGDILIPVIYDSVNLTNDDLYIAKRKSEIVIYTIYGDTLISNDSVKIETMNNVYITFYTYKDNKYNAYKYIKSEKCLYLLDFEFDSVYKTESNSPIYTWFLNGKHVLYYYSLNNTLVKKFISTKNEIETDDYIYFAVPNWDVEIIESFDNSETTLYKNIEIVNNVDTKAHQPTENFTLHIFLADNIRYPKECYINNIQGEVFVRFVVLYDGSIKYPFILNKVHPSLEKEALRIIEILPKFIPGTYKGKPINSFYDLTIKFKIG
jgi:hypothetical protein